MEHIFACTCTLPRRSQIYGAKMLVHNLVTNVTLAFLMTG